MSNDYFEHNNLLSRHTLGRAETTNAIFSAIAAGFAKLPGISAILHSKIGFAVDTGTEDAYAVSLAKPITSYEEGTTVKVKITNTNTGACTLDVDGVGIRPIKLINGTDPAAGDLVAGDFHKFMFSTADNQFILQGFSASLQAALIAQAVLSVSGTIGSLNAVYIGGKSSDPTVDNNGNTLVAGALYYNTVELEPKIYNGSSWVTAALDVNGALVATNNLSDLGNTKAALDSLGLRYTVSTATMTATRYQQVSADVSGGAWTLSLPTTPSSGDWVKAVVATGDPNTNNLTVSGNGKTINGDPTLVMDVARVQVTFIYTGTEWRIS